ncbi:glycosyltransferase [Candidatus Microgenomates bacterium]|nr:glycosyltransferase [Candidatus Microgenomates bacterium]
MKVISIVIPNFNSGHLLKKNLPKLINLLNKSKLKYEIIVTDDASTDNSLLEIRNLELVIITSNKNTGFGGNVDRGIRQAKGEIVFIINAIDALPRDETYFNLLLKHFENPKVFSVGATKFDVQNHGCGNIFFRKGYFFHQRNNGPKPLTAWADGGAQALRKDYYFKIGGFDPIYKFYWEDVDLGYRAWKAGYEVHFEQKAVLLHKKEHGPISRFYSEKQTRIMSLRNQMIFTWKNADFLFLVSCNLYSLYYIGVALKNFDGDWFWAYFQAVTHLPKIFYRRYEQKKVAKKSDWELLKII